MRAWARAAWSVGSIRSCESSGGRLCRCCVIASGTVERGTGDAIIARGREVMGDMAAAEEGEVVML